MLTKQAQQASLLAAASSAARSGRMVKLAEARARKGLSTGEKVFGHTVGRVAGAPFRAIGGGLASLLLGPKHQFGINRGKRLQAIKGGPGKGLEAISPAEYADIKMGKKRGSVVSGVIGNRAVHYKRRYGYGGLVGLVRRNPGKTLGAAGVAYMLGNSKAARDIASAVSPSMREGEYNPVSEDVLRSINSRTSGANPLGSSVWG